MVNAFTKSIANILAAGLAAVLAFSGPASAATVASWTSGDVGLGRTVSFNGYSPGYLGGSTPVPGLSAQLKLTLESISANDWKFGYDLTNTSVAPVDLSRVTVFGFDIAEPYAGVTSTGLFNSPHSGATQLVGPRNLCFSTIGFGQCIGSYFGGVSQGGSAGGIFDLKFAAAQVQVQLSHMFVAYQGVSSRTLCLCHQNGAGVGAVPEPSTWAMLISGVAAIGAATRRRRALAA
jgi:hypothetical protein